MHPKAVLPNCLKGTMLIQLLMVSASNATEKQKKQKSEHVDQAKENKCTITICIEDPCKKSSMGLGSANVKIEAISNNLSSLMGIVQVHNQMNPVHEELKDTCTL